MFLDYSDEQRMVAQTVKEFVSKHIAPINERYNFGRALIRDELREIWDSLVPEMMRLGEGFDLSGLDYISLAILLEELFKANPSLTFTILLAIAPAGTLFLYGNPGLKEKYIPLILSGNKIGCTAITEPDVGSNPAEVRSTAILEGDTYILNGTKTWITCAEISDLAIVTCRLREEKSERIGLLLVDRELSPYDSSGLSHLGLKGVPTGELYFNDCRVPVANRIGSGESASKGDLGIVLHGFEYMRVVVGLAAVALARDALEHSISYAKQRRQWGKYIGEHQMIQEMITDMATSVECARLLVYRALSLLQQGKRCEREACMAKYFATEMAAEVASKAVQIHGGNGLSQDYPIERIFRDARMLTVPDGTTQIQKLIIGRELLGLSAFG
jgi:acyl-CoA dehydrogenase